VLRVCYRPVSTHLLPPCQTTATIYSPSPQASRSFLVELFAAVKFSSFRAAVQVSWVSGIACFVVYQGGRGARISRAFRSCIPIPLSFWHFAFLVFTWLDVSPIWDLVLCLYFAHWIVPVYVNAGASLFLSTGVVLSSLACQIWLSL
jgi:hypothetical protein